MCIFIQLKLELLTQLPAANEAKYLFLCKMNIIQIYLFDKPLNMLSISMICFLTMIKISFAGTPGEDKVCFLL